MKTKEQARKLLIEHNLLTPDQDPEPSSLSTVLLHLEHLPGVTAPGAEAIRAVALLLDSLSTPSSNTTTPNTSSTSSPNEMHKNHPSSHPASDLADQIAEIKTTIQELRKAAATNETSANMLSNTVDETRNELHNAAQVVSNSVDKLTDNLDRSDTSPTPDSPSTAPSHDTDKQSIVMVLQEIKTLIRERPSAPPTSYKDALLKSSPNQRAANHPSLQEQARANAAVKERQILIDLAEDHPIKRQFNTHDEMLTLFQTALDAIKEQDSPDLKLKSLIILKNGGILLELTNKEAVEWTKNNECRRKLAEATGGNLTIKDSRFFNVVVPFVLIWTQLESEETLQNIEEDNKIPQNSITSARWIKPVNKRSPFQMYAHMMLSLTSPTVANQLLKNGLYVSNKLLRPIKDKKEPLCYLKCQKWGHLARVCKAEVDTCGICADNHRTSACPSEKPQICVNCNTTDHPSSSRKCPEFLRRCSELNNKTSPENSMPYFPTEEDWMQAALPPKATGNLVPTQPPRSQISSAPKARQATLDGFANRRRTPPSDKTHTQTAHLLTPPAATAPSPSATRPSSSPSTPISPSSLPLPPSPAPSLPPPLSPPHPKDDPLLSTDETTPAPIPSL